MSTKKIKNAKRPHGEVQRMATQTKRWSSKRKNVANRPKTVFQSIEEAVTGAPLKLQRLYVDILLDERAKRHASDPLDKEGEERRALAWLAGYKAAVEDIRGVVERADGPGHSVGFDVQLWLERQS